MDENTLHEILNEVDLNKNGQVELNEFLQVSCGDRKQEYLLVICPPSLDSQERAPSQHSCCLI